MKRSITWRLGPPIIFATAMTMTYDSYSFVSRGDDTTAYVGSAVVGTNTADEIVITADMLNSMETSTEPHL